LETNRFIENRRRRAWGLAPAVIEEQNS
jgi:hypothetical protein